MHRVNIIKIRIGINISIIRSKFIDIKFEYVNIISNLVKVILKAIIFG